MSSGRVTFFFKKFVGAMENGVLYALLIVTQVNAWLYIGLSILCLSIVVRLQVDVRMTSGKFESVGTQAPVGKGITAVL